jgi:uncharacterized membrane protein
MIHTTNIFFISAISMLGLIGFFLASYIHRKKKSKKKLICPMHSNCDTVIHSDYSTIVGIPVEGLGMAYYAFIAVIYGTLFLFNLLSAPVVLVLVGISLCSVLFSLYLVSLQAFVLHHFCIWCTSSACTSILIFVLSYIYYTHFFL